MAVFRSQGMMLTEKKSKFVLLKRYKYFYLLLLLPIIHQLVFSYAPLYGIMMAFKDFRFGRGILGSDWVGLKHFIRAFNDILFTRALRNTITLSILSLITSFPITIIFALLLNELKHLRFKKIVQTVSYLPHFLSWVIVAQFIYQILSPQSGFLNWFLVNSGLIETPRNFIIMRSVFRPMFILSGLWKSIGWGSIIYLAAIAGIETSQYEAADIEGANRFQKAVHITVPGIVPTIVILLILNVGGILNVGFDQVFNLYNPSTYQVADVISTFVFRQGLVDARYDYSTAVGLFQNLVGFILILITNYFAKRASDYTLL